MSAPRYVRNTDLHRDLKISPVVDEIKKNTKRHNERLKNYVHKVIQAVIDATNKTRRLLRIKPYEIMAHLGLGQCLQNRDTLKSS